MNRKERRAQPKIAGETAPQLLARQVFAEAVGHHRLGQLAEAETLYRAVVTLMPNHPEACYNLGLALQTQRRLPDAVAAYRQAIALRAEFIDAYSNLGTALQDLGQLDEAVAVYRQGITVQPGFAMLHGNLGVALKEQGKVEEAIAAYRQAIALKPDYDGAFANLGAALLEEGDAEAALVASRQALAINPRVVIAHCNIGAAYKALCDLPRAETAYRQAVAIAPDFPEAHFSLAQILLLKGDLEGGFREYEWRWKLKDYGWLRAIHGDFAQPRWQGEALTGKTILVYAEQGLGDAMQFARFLPELMARGGKVILAAHPPLISLLRSIDGLSVVALDQPFPPFDLHCPLLSVPTVLGTTLATLPAAIPYLHPEPDAIARWRGRIGSRRLKVGLVWAGNPAQRGDRLRSPRLAALAPLFDVPEVDFVALQLGAGREDIATHPLPANVLDLGPEIASFADTAAIMAGLDLVITSCTAPLHLAGALGVKTWATIPFAPHFFWLLDRSDSPWYPSLTLYRQDQPSHDWSALFGRVAADLAALAAEHAKE